MSMNGPELDYTAQIEARSYYFISDGELDSYTLRSFLILLTFSGDPRFVDVDIMDDRTSSTSAFSTRRADFREALIERDGTCVLSSHTARACDACHCIPHSLARTGQTSWAAKRPHQVAYTATHNVPKAIGTTKVLARKIKTWFILMFVHEAVYLVR